MRRVPKPIILAVLVVGAINLLLYSKVGYGHIQRISNRLQAHSGGCDAHFPPVSKPAGYSIKPITYIFPQYYPFPENDRLWGVNFTEWDNVRKVTHNYHGLETIRPHESIGYYNGLEFGTRARQGRYMRENGIYGAAFHHYWFDGKPVMDHIIQAMLRDGEPNIPFMLSWANEPWTATWDGLDSSEVLIAQDYGGVEDWRRHFDWLLPFFRHPNYIRSGGRIQFMVYSPQHMAHIGPHMFAAWRQWALEEGLGGMDVIETRWWGETWNQGIPDAVNEFQPHTSGPDHQKHPFSRRISRDYHRGTLVCWDRSPRNFDDSGAQPTCHPKTFQYHLVEMFRKIKEDPNPIGSENFLFINALNEWGEGNTLEPSVQFGDGYATAIRNAIQISDELDQWPDTLLQDALELSAQTRKQVKAQKDVCVLVWTHPGHREDQIFTLPKMLRSLDHQNNPRWRALILQTSDENFDKIEDIASRMLDPRIKHVSLPKEETSPYTAEDAGYNTIDWIIRNLATLDSTCASARYLLLASGANTYTRDAFDAAAEARADLLALNVESRQTVWDHGQLEARSWDDRCVRLDKSQSTETFCTSSASAPFDLGATFLNLTRFKAEGHTFANLTVSHPGHQAGAMVGALVDAGWQWAEPEGPACHVMHNPAYSACRTSGNFWFDSPLFDETGCYTTSSFKQEYGGFGKVDLKYYRANAFCLRYKEEEYSGRVSRGDGTTDVRSNLA